MDEVVELDVLLKFFQQNRLEQLEHMIHYQDRSSLIDWGRSLGSFVDEE